MNKCVLFTLGFGFSLLILACNAQDGSSRASEKYLKYKKEWDPKMVDHFPAEVLSYPADVISSKDNVKNNMWFMLYEYNMGAQKIDSLIKQLETKSIARYSSSDSCLLVVNRFETNETYENRLDIEIADSTKIDKPCYDKLLPIPNFINSNYPTSKSGLKLNDKFNIYVLDVKSGKYGGKYDLNPSPQMPFSWKNGYSRGIALSEEEKTIIYWTIIW